MINSLKECFLYFENKKTYKNKIEFSKLIIIFFVQGLMLFLLKAYKKISKQQKIFDTEHNILFVNEEFA